MNVAINKKTGWLHCILMLVLVATMVSAQNPTLTDSKIKQALEHEFVVLPELDANQIDLEVVDGVVTLDGTVPHLLMKERALTVCEAIRGVRSVVNLLEVKTADVPNDKLAEEVEKALLADPATDSYELTVKARDGVVTLSGKVDSWAEKLLAGTVAKGVKGVTDLKNTVGVNYKRNERPDLEIKEDVEGRLRYDIWVDDALIDVEVNDGKVQLSGAVGSAAERRWAGYDAWVNGVSDVNTEDLEIMWWVRDKMKRRDQYVSRSDEELKNAIEEALRYDPRVLSFDIKVDTESGTVTLSGIVDNLQAKRAAEKDARNTIGVWRVNNHIKVRPVNFFTNAELEARVNHAIRRDPYLEQDEITVEARDGMVTLSGAVDSKFERSHATTICSQLEGVTRLNNDLVVNREWLWRSDYELQEDIRDQLKNNTFLEAGHINVSVVAGEATLTGYVDTWHGKLMAADEAYQGGARKVKNLLAVTHGLPPSSPPYQYNYLPKTGTGVEQ